MANEKGNIDLFTLMTSAGVLWQNATVCALKAAYDVLNESASTNRHAERVQWAQNVISNPSSWVDQNRYRILQNATVRSGGHSATDDQVQVAVNSLIAV